MGTAASRTEGENKFLEIELDIQKDKMGWLIGTKGATIKKLTETSVATITTPLRQEAETNNKFAVVAVRGKAKDVFHTCGLVDQVVEVSNAFLVMDVTPSDGNHLREVCEKIQQETNTLVKVVKKLRKHHWKQVKDQQHPGSWKSKGLELSVTVEGFLEDVEKGYRQVIIALEKEDVKGKRFPDRRDFSSAEISLTPAMIASLKGTGLKALREEIRAHYDFDEAGAKIRVKGTQYQITRTRTMLEDITGDSTEVAAASDPPAGRAAHSEDAPSSGKVTDVAEGAGGST